MPSHTETKTLPYTAEQVYTLVADVGSYGTFLPWCQGVRVYDRQADHFKADLLIGYKVLREKYTSRVHLEPHSGVRVEYLKGPFKRLENHWTFRPLDNGHCEIQFFIDFEFGSKLLQGLVTGLFHEIVKRMVTGFETEAHRRYGRRASDRVL